MSYTLKKVLNSSVVLVYDESQNEYILLGKGIGYGKKPGQTIESSSENQMFVPIQDSKSKHFQELMDDIPLEILQVTQEIILSAKQVLQTEFQGNLYLILADHLNFAIERLKKGINITNRVFWEIKNYYPNEFRTGMLAVTLVEEKLGIQLPDQEAANIAFHFANASSITDSNYDSAKYAKVIAEINNIVVFSINRPLDKKSIHYMRFVTHIKFFVERYFTNSMLTNEDDVLYSQIKIRNPKEFAIACKVKDFLEKKYKIQLPYEEITFLVVHINRLMG